MPDTPDFDAIAANRIAAKILRLSIDNFDPRWNASMRVIVEELRLIWNARGAADLAAVNDIAHTNYEAIEGALRRLDR